MTDKEFLDNQFQEGTKPDWKYSSDNLFIYH